MVCLELRQVAWNRVSNSGWSPPREDPGGAFAAWQAVKRTFGKEREPKGIKAKPFVLYLGKLRPQKVKGPAGSHTAN